MAVATTVVEATGTATTTADTADAGTTTDVEETATAVSATMIVVATAAAATEATTARPVDRLRILLLEDTEALATHRRLAITLIAHAGATTRPTVVKVGALDY